MKSGRILVMRHAEKSDDPLDAHVSPPGVERAKRLATHILKTFGRPDYRVATLKSKHSNRPYETLKPLSGNWGSQSTAISPIRTTARSPTSFVTRIASKAGHAKLLRRA
jgi:hypothetical protein